MIKFVLFLALSIAMPLQAQEDWVTFKDKQGLFSVELPLKPEPANSVSSAPNGKQIPVISYVIENDFVSMSVVVADFKDTPVGETLLDDIIRNTSSGQVLMSNKTDTLDNRAGRRVMFTSVADGGVATARMFFFDGRLIQLTGVVYPEAEAEDRAMVTRFVESLRFPAGKTGQKKQ